MNRDVLKGQWHQLKGQLRKRWGKLSDDDLAQIEGDAEILIGRLQQHYGGAREKLEADVDAWLEEQRIAASTGG